MCFDVRLDWIQILSQLLTSCMTLGKSLNLTACR